MNKKIQALAKKAFVKERLDSNPKWKESVFSDALLKDFEVIFENFAELIIQECMYVGRLSQIENKIVDAELKDHFKIGLS